MINEDPYVVEGNGEKRYFKDMNDTEKLFWLERAARYATMVHINHGGWDSWAMDEFLQEYYPDFLERYGFLFAGKFFFGWRKPA